MAKKNGQLARLNQMQQALAEAKTLEDFKSTADISQTFTHWAKKIGATRTVCNQGTDIFIQSKVGMGRALGPPPGKGPGRGKKRCNGLHVLSKEQARDCRAVAHKVPGDIYQRYRGWIQHHSTDHLTFRDVLTLAKLGDLQEPVLAALETNKAESLAEAIRIVRHDEIVDGEVDVAKGEYRTIVIDPPWDIQKIQRDAAPRQAGLDYVTMSVDAITELVMPAAEQCHLYLWTTQKYLPQAFGILDAWGFDYVVTMVWKKAGGFQPVNLPQYNCEFVLFGRRGGLGFTDTKDFMCCFTGKRRGHSRKPVEFYDLIRRVSPAPRIDMFTRETHKGFDGWGNESGKFDA